MGPGEMLAGPAQEKFLCSKLEGRRRHVGMAVVGMMSYNSGTKLQISYNTISEPGSR